MEENDSQPSGHGTSAARSSGKRSAAAAEVPVGGTSEHVTATAAERCSESNLGHASDHDDSSGLRYRGLNVSR